MGFWVIKPTERRSPHPFRRQSEGKQVNWLKTNCCQKENYHYNFTLLSWGGLKHRIKSEKKKKIFGLTPKGICINFCLLVILWISKQHSLVNKVGKGLDPWMHLSTPMVQIPYFAEWAASHHDPQQPRALKWQFHKTVSKTGWEWKDGGSAIRLTMNHQIPNNGVLGTYWWYHREGHGSPLQYFCLKNPRTEEPSGLYSPWSCKRIGHDLVTKQQTTTNRWYQFTLTLFPSMMAGSIKSSDCLPRRNPWYWKTQTWRMIRQAWKTPRAHWAAVALHGRQSLSTKPLTIHLTNSLA